MRCCGDGTVREPEQRTWLRRLGCSVLAAALIALAVTTQAAVGLTEIPGKEGDGAVTVYYPSSSDAHTVKRGPFSLQLAQDGALRRGNGRLVVISHGSGGSPWVHANLARALVEDGFIVAMPAIAATTTRTPARPAPKAGDAGRSRSRTPSCPTPRPSSSAA